MRNQQNNEEHERTKKWVLLDPVITVLAKDCTKKESKGKMKLFDAIYLIRCFSVKYCSIFLQVVLYFDEPAGP